MNLSYKVYDIGVRFEQSYSDIKKDIAHFRDISITPNGEKIKEMTITNVPFEKYSFAHKTITSYSKFCKLAKESHMVKFKENIV